MARFIDSTTAAALLGVSRQTLYSYVSRGLLHAQTKPDGRGKYYLRNQVERLAKQAEEARKPRSAAGATLDFGLPVLPSALTLIARGQLWYRGRNALTLAETGTLEDVACLLWQCRSDPFSLLEAARYEAPPRPASSLHPLERAMTAFPWLAQQAGALPVDAGLDRQHERCALLLRMMAAVLLGSDVSNAEIHLQCAHAWGLSAADSEHLRRALVLCADHELNASSFAARCVASTGAQLHASVLGGLVALSGPRHGMASEQVEAWLDTLNNAKLKDESNSLLTNENPPPGFGHRLYPEGDPRARSILAALPHAPMLTSLCETLERQTGEYANLDFALVALRRSLGLPRHSASVLFALGRTAGWLAHALEQGQQKGLIRPRALYVGEQTPGEGATLPGRKVRMGKG
jgi:citrate synthase